MTVILVLYISLIINWFNELLAIGTPKLSSTATVRIRVKDLNDNAPEITVPQENDVAAFRINAQALQHDFIGKVCCGRPLFNY